jgi:hypothetical protein
MELEYLDPLGAMVLQVPSKVQDTAATGCVALFVVWLQEFGQLFHKHGSTTNVRRG